MTVIEFFDKTPIENIVATVTANFNKIIFLGENDEMKAFKPIYEKFKEGRKLDIEICYRGINKNKLGNIVNTISKIVEEEETCLFDLTGGDDLALVAIGLICRKYPEKNIQLQRLNLNNGELTDCDEGDKIIEGVRPYLTVDEYIGLYGGDIYYVDPMDADKDDPVGTYCWELSEEFKSDVDELWEICRNNPRKWNSEIAVLIKMCELPHNQQTLSVSVSRAFLERYLKSQNTKSVPISGLLRILENEGFINNLELTDGVIAFNFKDMQIRKCLTKAGTVLELKVLTSAIKATRKDGSRIYNECMNGVYIDWDGGEYTEDDTVNEIDVVLLSGMIPMFISCKNGRVEDDELYKLETVSNRFGGENVKKFLIASYVGREGESKEHLVSRAADMGIEFIERVHELDRDQFDAMIKQLVNARKDKNID